MATKARNSPRDEAATSDDTLAASLCISSCFVPSIKSRMKNFAHGTEIMKPCQEFLCPVDSFEYDMKCIK